MATMIGVVSWQGPTVAELWGMNVWKARVNGIRDPQLEANLKALYEDRMVYSGPWDGYYGFSVLKDLSEQMGGRFRFLGSQPTEDDRVY